MQQVIAQLSLLVPAAVVSFLLSVNLILLLRPWLRRHALAHANARSSHLSPTPQGGGIAVIAAATCITWVAAAITPALLQGQIQQFLVLTAAIMLLAVVGAVDDVHPLPAAPRLALQMVAVGATIAALPSDWHIIPHLPWWAERGAIFIGALWFVNLVNFMDGIDWMTVAEFVPALGALTLFALAEKIDPLAAVLAVALLGATLGFAPFNKPVARLFLGDAGSLPMGLVLGWLLLQLAENGHLAAALILPLYYVLDATTTLLRRAVRHQPLWRAHRDHFYQRALDQGLTVSQVILRVFLVNIALAALALLTLAAPGLGWLALVAGAAIVLWLLRNLVRGEAQA
jgi:UDP-N-acetylmuramyl pentapeptide phosphotransferase/UDP-N-acetylglucosamine-1-phosphate transferase